MAFIDTVVNDFGKINNAGDANALFLKIFSGEVLASFLRETVALPKVMRRSISNGKSVQFPLLGRQTANYHTPGERLAGTNIYSGEKTIVIDTKPLVSSVFISEIDEAKSHFEVRSQYSFENGQAIAWKLDRQLFNLMIAAARQGRQLQGTEDAITRGTVLYNSSMKSDALTLAAGLFKAAEILDTKSIPQNDRVCFLAPAQYYMLAQNTTAINKEFGGMGSYSDGTIVKIAGIELVKTINLPTGDSLDSDHAQYSSRHVADLAGVVVQKDAVGLVDLIGVTSDMEERKSELGVLMFSKYLKGADWLRPAAAIELTAKTNWTETASEDDDWTYSDNAVLPLNVKQALT